MLLRLLAAFILVPLIELYLLLQLAEVTSVFTTIAVVIGTGIVGSILARREGVMAWLRFRTAVAEGRVPSREIQDGLMIVFAAALLLTPGLLTDAVGFALLIPVGRDLFRRSVLRRYFRGADIRVSTSGRGEDNDFSYHTAEYRQRPVRFRDGYTIDAESVQRKE